MERDEKRWVFRQVLKISTDRNEFHFVSDQTWKKLVLTVELICLSDFKPESKITERFLAWEFTFNDRGPAGLIVVLE